MRREDLPGAQPRLHDERSRRRSVPKVVRSSTCSHSAPTNAGGWAPIVEMSAAMWAGFALVAPAVSSGTLDRSGGLVVGHILMLALMLVAMTLRRDHYSARHRQIRNPATPKTQAPRSKVNHPASRPPSITNSVPVTEPASALHGQGAAAAISEASPRRPAGMAAATRARISGVTRSSRSVRIGPGRVLFTRMRSAA